VGDDKNIVSLSLPILDSNVSKDFLIRNRLYTNPEVGTHNTVAFVN
jgi:hypothetical protein